LRFSGYRLTSEDPLLFKVALDEIRETLSKGEELSVSEKAKLIELEDSLEAWAKTNVSFTWLVGSALSEGIHSGLYKWDKVREAISANVDGSKVAEAEANASKAKNQFNAQSQSLDQQMETAYKLYQIATYQVKVLDQEVVQLAASAQRIAEVSYRYGERGMLEYLDAQRTFRAARNDLIKARFDLASVVTEIQRLRASPQWLAKIEGGMQ
jgi:outer membrane protein TolC